VNVNLPGLPAFARAAAGALMGGVVAALIFLVMVQGSFHKGITDFDYAHVLGTAIKGTAEEQRDSDALGVIGDTAGPTALWTTLVAGVVLMAVHGLVVTRFVRRRWEIQGLVTGLIAFLAIGVIYGPYVDANLDSPIGPWGADQGGWTPIVFLVSCVAASLVGSRCYSLAVDAGWWETDRVVVDEQLAELTGVDTELLELPEKGAEQGTMRP
jgi:hypothetical protein